MLTFRALAIRFVGVGALRRSNTAGLDKEFFCPLYVGDYPHFGRDYTQKHVLCMYYACLVLLCGLSYSFPGMRVH